LIYEIRPDNFLKEVATETKPVLLLCMPQGEAFHSQIKIIEDIATRYNSLIKVGLLEDAYIETFKTNLHIHGTPTYLIMIQGEEKNRMIGLTDLEALTAFVSSHLISEQKVPSLLVGES